jgi:hypothetical protein
MATMNTTVQSSKPRFDETIATDWNRQSPDALRTQLKAIHADLRRLEREFELQLAGCALHKESARNLIHYLALRRRDIRQLQEELADWASLRWAARNHTCSPVSRRF